MKTIIGTVTTYHGTEHPYLVGSDVRVVAVLKNVDKPGYDPDKDGLTIRNDADLKQAGGITKFDRIEVQPGFKGRWSFVTSDAKVKDLKCFRKG